MRNNTTPDAPLVPPIDTDATEPTARTDGGRDPPENAFDRPPRTDYASEYTRDEEEIEPFVADLR